MPDTKLVLNTPEEEAAIQRGIDQDPDNPEWTADDFAKAQRLGDSRIANDKQKKQPGAAD